MLNNQAPKLIDQTRHFLNVIPKLEQLIVLGGA
jgi:hypothetical protein